MQCSRDFSHLPVASHTAVARRHDCLARAVSLDVAVIGTPEVLVRRVRLEPGVTEELLGVDDVVASRGIHGDFDFNNLGGHRAKWLNIFLSQIDESVVALAPRSLVQVARSRPRESAVDLAPRSLDLSARNPKELVAALAPQLRRSEHNRRLPPTWLDARI